jgi:hypothetical protein
VTFAIADAIWEAISTEPFSFLIGGLVGWLGAQRYRVVRVRKEASSDRPERTGPPGMDSR